MRFFTVLKRIYELVFLSDEQYARKIGVTIGENCNIMTREFGSEPYLIFLGDNVQITKDVKFFTHGGSFLFRKENPDFDVFGKIRIGNNVYIGNNALIMLGVTIGDNVLIAAGTVVTKSIPNNVVIAGIPAKIVNTLDNYKKSIVDYNVNSKNMDFNDKRIFLMSLSEDNFISKPYLKSDR